ncbi:hypothetical protein [Limobrevibacterium gyesilva]|uniref:Lipoprotein n=1 Tax=Limobrevibacterium gyesilva TaxID=2991712 RepID=A0AA42CGG4_9PROT|nr:hypothetical protein [Limobrevibacterium gyesilva]MCW3476011.1 hypothetical protein [Limobrevibacterium gyesilva]
MRRMALLGSILLLSACESPSSYVGNPLSGFGGFVSNTTSLRLNPNGPTGPSDNMRRVRGEEFTTEPLLPEAGNIWPGPPPPEPTLMDLQRQQMEPLPPVTPPEQPRPAPPRGSSTPPVPVTPTPLPGVPGAAVPPRAPAAPVAVAPGGVVQTPQGPATIRNSPNGVQTYTLPSGVTGRAINNGNGTMTLIGPDGSVQSVPVPR